MSHQRSKARSERWEREDKSPRLNESIPGLTRLVLKLGEWANGRLVLDSERVQHVVVAHAAAHFEVPCSNQSCDEGGYDLTYEILRQLKARGEQFEGQDRCSGYVGDHPCGRTLHFTASASFS